MFLRWLGIVFFATHIPATLLVDAQALLPAYVFPKFARKMLENFIEQYNDPLMSAAMGSGGSADRRWFLSLVATELLIQLPFFFVALYAFVARREWIRVPLVAYGGFVTATMVPILSELALAEGLGAGKRAALLMMYVPYLVVPAVFVVWECRRERLFAGGTEDGGRGSRKKTR